MLLKLLIAPLLLLLTCLLVSAHGAQAASCSASVSALDFGNVDTLSARPTDSSGEITFSCSDVASGATVVTVCANLGAGSGGAVAGVRQLMSGGQKLGYRLFADASRSVPWGSADTTALGQPQSIQLPVSGTGASGIADIYGAVDASQAAAPPGTYSSTFAAIDASFIYAEGALDCSAPASGTATNGSFLIDAQIAPNCLIDAEDIDFGHVGIIDHNVDASGGLAIHCTPGTSYSVGLNGGLSGATDPTQRKMRAGPNTVTYGLYENPNRSQPWGDGAGAIVAGTGSGAGQALTIYGRVPPQNAVPGNYADTVVVTITYGP